MGRAVEDHELTSITAWMRIPDRAARASREAEKYDATTSSARRRIDHFLVSARKVSLCILSAFNDGFHGRVQVQTCREVLLCVSILALKL